MKRSVDEEKLSSALRRLTRRDLLVVLERALGYVPNHQIAGVVEGFIAFDQLVGTAGKRTGVLDNVKAFDAASRCGEYHESFNVNSKNYMQKSAGTEEWIEECNRLLGDLVGFVAKGDPTPGREAFERIFALLRRIDEGTDDIVFFADEAGSWQVHVEWSSVLPAYFRCLAATAAPAEYAEQVRAIIKDFAEGSSKYLSAARSAATKEQQVALAGRAKRAETAAAGRARAKRSGAT